MTRDRVSIMNHHWGNDPTSAAQFIKLERAPQNIEESLDLPIFASGSLGHRVRGSDPSIVTDHLYRIDTADQLPSWQKLVQLTSTNTRMLVIDTTVSPRTQRFYRAVEQ